MRALKVTPLSGGLPLLDARVSELSATALSFLLGIVAGVGKAQPCFAHGFALLFP